MISKTIHYCWFGGNPLPKLAQNCIKSWKKFCPDYEIREWNEQTFSIPDAPLYVRQAYEAKKWAFITDYVRLWAMTKFGGIYMDTDVEVIKSLDNILKYEAVSGFESDEQISTGLMASQQNFPLFVELLKDYDTMSFINPDGSLNLTTNVTLITNKCLEYGFIPNNSLQTVAGFTLFPKDYFCPKDGFGGPIKLTENTMTIHHFDGSWASAEDKKKWADIHIKRQQQESKRFRKKLPGKIVRYVFGERFYSWLKGIVQKFQ